MPSTATTRLRLEKQAAGENDTTWGTRLNSNVIDLVDVAIAGRSAFTLSGTKTLSTADYSSDESRAIFLDITSGTGGTVTIPNVEKVYIVRNNTSGTVTFTTGSGTTADVATGDIQWLMSTGSNVIYATSFGKNVSTFIKTLLDDTDAATARTTLGVPLATTAEFRANTADKVLVTDDTWAAADYVSLTDAATVAVDMSTGINFTVTLGGNRALGNPTNTKNGQSGVIQILQDGTGSRTLSYSSNWKFPSGTAPNLSTAASARDLLFYQVISSTVIFGNLVKGVA